MGEKIIVEKEMGLTHKEFFRTLPSALGKKPFEQWENGARLTEGDQVFEIRLGKEGERRIALMVIPRMMVTLEFTNYTQEEVEKAIKLFDLMFKRGGG